MSTEEIIKSWKNEPASRALHSNEELETKPEKAPANPAGDQELSDEELALVEGGGSADYCSCKSDSCTKIA